MLFKSAYQTVFFLFPKRNNCVSHYSFSSKNDDTNVSFTRGLNYRKTVVNFKLIVDNWLIGSTSERKELKSEIEFNFMKSLKSDKEKHEVELAEETNKLAKVKSMNVKAS